jgi:hypothetical protein
MFRYKWKKRSVYKKSYWIKKFAKKALSRLLNVYADYRLRIFSNSRPLPETYKNILVLNHRRRQQHYAFHNLKTNTTLTQSTGQIIAQYGNYGKFFKRSPSSVAGIALQLKKTKSHLLGKLYLLSVKNLAKKQLLLLEKLFDLSTFFVYYFVHKKSYLMQSRRKHRIARSVLRLLQKQKW